MKRYLLIAAVVLGALSCTKENMPTENNDQPLVFTASIEMPVSDDQGKTAIDVYNGKVSWRINDMIKITDANSKTAVYKVAYIDANGVATFTKKDGDDLTINSTYTATYKDSINFKQQWYEENRNGANCPMSASTATVYPGYSSVNHFVFHNVYGVVNISATAKDICAIKIGDYTLNFWNPMTITAGKDYFMIALPYDKTFNSVTFVKSNGRALVSNFESSSISVEKNHLKNVKLTNAKYDDDSQYTGFEPLALPGIFSVDGKKVRFSRGNLWKEGGKLYVEKKQYDFRTDAGYDSSVETVKSTTAANQTGLFEYGDIYSSDACTASTTGWRALKMSANAKTSNEFYYMNETTNNWRKTNLTMAGVTNTKILNVIIGSIFDEETSGVKGLLVFPDNIYWPDGVAMPTMSTLVNKTGQGYWYYTTYYQTYVYMRYSIEEFEKLERAGVVFFPCAGYSQYESSTWTVKNTSFVGPSTTTAPNNPSAIMYMTDTQGRFIYNTARYNSLNYNWYYAPSGTFKVPVRLVHDVD